MSAENIEKSDVLLAGKKILLGITGGIAAYKAAELTRTLVKRGAKVKVIMTRSAQEFVRPLTFATLSGNSVNTEMFQQNLVIDDKIKHIALARWADAICIAPASANIIAKIANGIADDLLSTVCLATTAPICVVPAMNKEMWNNKITALNVEKLGKLGVKFFGPANGVLACGEVGSGKMLEPIDIVSMLRCIFVRPLLRDGKKIRLVITAGSTIEPIDPVRFISNHSSGKMGYAIAQAAADYGVDVTLISGSTSLPQSDVAKLFSVETADQMFEVAMQEVNKGCDIFIAAAAVADYKVENVAKQKIKKANKNHLDLHLLPNPDILASIAALPNPPFTVGFAAETENLIENAKRKLQEKKVNLMAANLVGKNLGFNSPNNALTLLAKNGEIVELSLKSKDLLACELLEFVFSAVLNAS